MKGRWIEYSAEELAWIEANKTKVRRKAHAEYVGKFGRSDVSLTNYNALCKRKGWMTGRTGQYEPGQEPMNKGQKMPFNANSARTQFKKGSVPPNRLPMWSERVGKDGYIEMKVPLENPHTGHSTRFMHKHRYLWEQANGPLPEGHALKCLDGDRTNTDPKNWEAVPRALLPRLSGRWCQGYDDAPEELKPTLMATAKLKHAINEAVKK
ncbi:HNH endonuclease signature motif containing protein [Ruegeria sp. Ofav3-42]|uniref:HNH endonuclease signature motif containing protein n=1 Tax=Ruegeria sp. Ofav3-42 TaxID=2917759 RepID=UPI001EF45C87|nr:HNH endonuclease signature motif containing protein [Ruegeria sp. Ofav3-42]MCG7522241.1 HNH endonuclease [Ruegeria sp. Ofav3-42]